MQKHRQEEGSNCFSYFRPNQIKGQRGENQDATNSELVQTIALLKLKSQKSGLQTETSSTSIKNLSYFEKMESLKAKITETHKRHKSGVDMDRLKAIMTQDVHALADGRQPAHSDWIKAKLLSAEQDGQASASITLEQYCQI